MERYFILDKFNTWYDWHLITTAKDISDPEPKTNYVNLDGMNGTLDLSEALTGEITYNDRTITATFWTDYGTRKEREALLRKITTSLHGKKVKIIEPDDPEHYFYGRVKIKSKKNIIPYLEFSIEATCEPWRYAVNESVRRIVADPNHPTKRYDIIINNNGVKALYPTVKVTGQQAMIMCNDKYTMLSEGVYKIPDIKLYQGVNCIQVVTFGSVEFSYREADL